jgi:hypothetical protein
MELSFRGLNQGEHGILKKAAAYFANFLNEVRVYRRASLAVHSQWHVPVARCSQQWLLSVMCELCCQCYSDRNDR